ncbi:hypothetical protein G6F57_008267 [Rhizopus arrhizus]|uniref:Uncharacterized protein n=1 Tax=Rhizopus oryzae TaxID=64495 RepID=A0A9P7BRD1_RHIOR|nr:hypothetical protein G6F23_003155 [Rhizopus arrhizus]KAG0760728.1 hypothetical protein G6F24_008099 [Rhizopus arrhizus]KAG0781411.1 hypothetical protein G6F22_009583 [Rhizopus arrhizus]KAG0785312.1 hypothetical protein G6F21_009340 [Rhizopus arrhizus]KAG0809395.1 hypothetical protein G6F20_008810 [Rhizopus arrhizus]
MNSVQSKFKSFSISANDSKSKSSEKSQLTSNPSQKKSLVIRKPLPKVYSRQNSKHLPKTQANMKKGKIPNGRLSNDCDHYQRSRSPVHTSGRATAEIYQEFQHVIENGGTEADMSNILERIQQTRSEESVIRRATQQKCNGFNKGGNTHRGFGRRGCANGNKEILLFREGEEDTGLLVVPRTISVVSASVFNMFKPLSFLYLSKPRTVEQIMNDINENDTANRYLTTGEAFELFKRLQIEERAQRDGNLHDSDLSLGISEYLDGTLMYELKEKSKRFKRQELIPELKQWKIDTFQIVNNIYKYSENTRVQARASTEIYKQSYYLQQKIQFNNEEDKHIFEGVVDQATKLADFEFGQAKF